MIFQDRSGNDIRHRLAFILASLLVCASLPVSFAMAESTVNQAVSAASKAKKTSSYRLPDFAIPEKYNLEFSPDPASGKFTGSAIIDLNVKKATKAILMNANDLLVSNAFIVGDAQDSASTPLQVSHDKVLEQVNFVSAKALAAGKYHLHCSFKGNLNDKLVGFYRSTYKDKSGKTHYLSVTQMEPTDARRMFPCYDEPAFKSAFKIKVKTDKINTAISNGSIEKESVDASGKKVIEFEETKPMSSYLVALCVGEFKSTEPIEKEGIPIRVWSVAHNPAMGNFARDNAAKLLTYLNSYFGTPYPWKKLDLIAIPDFQAGAMENPGAITFREKFLLAEEASSSLSTKQDIVGIIAHEMAHLWFGDLVTMAWWDDIWLNEAFATWMADKATDKVKPEWNCLDQFFGDRWKAFLTDSLHATRTIQSPVLKPEDAEQMFDEITYVKGASVLRMLEFYLGEKVFQQGVSAYIKEYSFGNATTNDLWNALQKASGNPVKDIMDTWCKQPGYPLVKVSSEPNSDLKFEQERFFLDGSSPGTQLWKVPVGMRNLNHVIAQDESNPQLFEPKYELQSTKTLSLPASQNTGLTLANAGGYGFYRTQYMGGLNQKIKEKLGSMLPVERLSFLSDHAALCFSGKIPAADFLDVLKLYRGETNFAVWDCILDSLKKLDRFVEPASRPAFSRYVRYVVSEEYRRLGWQSKSGEAEPLRLVRGNVIAVLGTLGEDGAVIEEARKVFAEYTKNPDSTNPDVLDAVVKVVAYNGAFKDFQTLKQLWKNADNPEREHRNLFALAAFRKPEQVNAALNLTISSEVRKQDASKLLAEFFEDNTSKVAAWKFMTSHWAQIKQTFAPHMLARLSEAPATLTTESAYAEAKSFFAINKVPDGAASIARMLEKLKINVQFKNKSGKALNVWLKDNVDKLN